MIGGNSWRAHPPEGSSPEFPRCVVENKKTLVSYMEVKRNVPKIRSTGVRQTDWSCYQRLFVLALQLCELAEVK